MTVTVTELHRYPVKGLSAEPLERCRLLPGEGIAHDRRFALAHGSTDFDPQAPRWLPKTNFLMLMRDEKLAQLRVRFEEESGQLTILRDGKQVVSAKAGDPVGRAMIAQFFASFMAGSLRGAPKLVEAARHLFPGHMFSDSRSKSLSIVNLASVADLERVVRREVHPLRFRANVHVVGSEPWAEFQWVGRVVSLGGARLRITAPIARCAATNVDPETAARDLNLPLSLQRGFGHVNMGVYGEAIEAGEVARGDSLIVAD